MLPKQELPPQGQELGQELGDGATPPDGLKPDGEQQGQSDDLHEELVPVSQLDAMRSVEQAKNAKLQRELQRLADENRALQLGQSQAAATLGTQLGQDPAAIQQAITQATTAIQIRQYQAAQAAEQEKERQVGWWARHFADFGVDAEQAPEFAQAYMQFDLADQEGSYSRFTQALKSAVARVQTETAEKEERERRFAAAKGVQDKGQQGQYMALDESGMALPPKAPYSETPLNEGNKLISEALKKPLPRRKRPGGE